MHRALIVCVLAAALDVRERRAAAAPGSPEPLPVVRVAREITAGAQHVFCVTLREADLLDAAGHYFARRLKPVVHSVLPLGQARQAHETMERSQHFGKIVLQVA